jgi:hypothetical protein
MAVKPFTPALARRVASRGNPRLANDVSARHRTGVSCQCPSPRPGP